MCIMPNQICCCLDCIHPIDESGQCLIAKMFEKPVNPEHGCSWRLPIKRKAVLTNAVLIDKKRTEAKVFLIARFFIDRPEREVELVKSVIHRCSEEIDSQPAIEAEPVRYGRWDEIQCFSEHGVEMASYECTSCGNDIERQRGVLPPYCEFCGAKMGGGADD